MFSLSYGWTNAHFERTWCVVRITFDIYFIIVIITGRIIHALASSFFRNSIKLLSFQILYNTLNWINTFNFKLLLKIIIKKNNIISFHWNRKFRFFFFVLNKIIVHLCLTLYISSKTLTLQYKGMYQSSCRLYLYS